MVFVYFDTHPQPNDQVILVTLSRKCWFDMNNTPFWVQKRKTAPKEVNKLVQVIIQIMIETPVPLTQPHFLQRPENLIFEQAS